MVEEYASSFKEKALISQQFTSELQVQDELPQTPYKDQLINENKPLSYISENDLQDVCSTSQVKDENSGMVEDQIL